MPSQRRTRPFEIATCALTHAGCIWHAGLARRRGRCPPPALLRNAVGAKLGMVLARQYVRRHADLDPDLLDFDPRRGGGELFRCARAGALGGSELMRALSDLASGSYAVSVSPVHRNHGEQRRGSGIPPALAVAGARYPSSVDPRGSENMNACDHLAVPPLPFS